MPIGFEGDDAFVRRDAAEAVVVRREWPLGRSHGSVALVLHLAHADHPTEVHVDGDG